MHRKKLYRDIHKKGQQLGTYVPGLLTGETAAVHDLRTQVKKLRAWLQWRGRSKKILPTNFKELYHITGQMRDIQVLLASYPENSASTPLAGSPSFPPDSPLAPPLLPGFKDWLQNGLARLQQLQADLRIPHTIGHFQATLKKQYLKKPNPRSLTAFFNDGVLQIKAIVYLPAPTDDHLHSIRKILKSMLYVYEWGIKNGLAGEKDEKPEVLKKLGQKAGDFNDRRMALSLLKAYLEQERDDTRKAEAAQVCQQWETACAEQKIHLLQSLRRFTALHGINRTKQVYSPYSS